MADLAPCTPWGGIFLPESMSSTVLLVTKHSCDGLIPDRLDFRRSPCRGRPTVDPSSGSLPRGSLGGLPKRPATSGAGPSVGVVLRWSKTCLGRNRADGSEWNGQLAVLGGNLPPSFGTVRAPTKNCIPGAHGAVGESPVTTGRWPVPARPPLHGSGLMSRDCFLCRATQPNSGLSGPTRALDKKKARREAGLRSSTSEQDQPQAMILQLNPIGKRDAPCQ